VLFGQILAALYQDDIVEEEDIRKWHALPLSKGEAHKLNENLDNIQRCWTIGGHMIHQFDEQGSDDDSNEGIDPRHAKGTSDKEHEEDKANDTEGDEGDDDDDEDDDEEEDDEEEDDDDDDDEEADHGTG
jgi:translation initiation factor eIF-2B subunit epsilon